MDIPIWVVQEIGRLNLELLAAQQRIRELEKQAVEHEKPLVDSEVGAKPA